MYRQQDSPDQQKLSPTLVVFGLTNGMVGSLALTLPLYAFNAGYIASLIVILLTGFFSYFSCYLYIKHLAGEDETGSAFQQHFGRKGKYIKKIYDSLASISVLLVTSQYFKFMVWSWKDLLPELSPDWMYLFVNALILVVFTFVTKQTYLGATFLAYGIFSIAAYIVFLFWALGSSNSEKQYGSYPPFNDALCQLNLAAAIAQGFVIQVFLVPILKKGIPKKQNKKKKNITENITEDKKDEQKKSQIVDIQKQQQKKFTDYTSWTYILGGIAYLAIAYLGSFAKLYRQESSTPRNGTFFTLLDYFENNQLLIKIIEAVYILHLYSVYPEFLLISQKKLYEDIFKLPQEYRKVMTVVFIFAFVGISVVFYNISFNNIVVINGAIISFFIVYLFPSILHFQCMKRKEKSSFYHSNSDPLIPHKILEDSAVGQYLACKCNNTKNKGIWALIIFMVLLGATVLTFGIYKIIKQDDACIL